MSFRIPVGRVSGRALALLAALTRRGPLKMALAALVRAELGIDAARRLAPEMRGPVPFGLEPRRARSDHSRSSAELGPPDTTGWPRSAISIAAAYRSGKSGPVGVVARALGRARTLAERLPCEGPLCGYLEERARVDAHASSERWARGAPLGELDGIPIAVKEEIDVEGLASGLGTRFEERVAARDAVFVARLRAAGAVVIGQTCMTEYGLSPLGVNRHRKMPRNVHHFGRLAGGSSTGAAVGVALGLFPLALATDGGGSIRTPAAYNGVFGLKPTYGRIPLTGHGMPGGTSVVHFGVIGASSADLALGCGVGQGADPDDPASLVAPPSDARALVRALGRGVRGISIGVPEREWSRADAAIADAGRAALGALEKEGVKLVPLELPTLPHAAAIGYMTIAIEARAALRAVEAAHWHDFGADLRILLAGADAFAADDYVDAQRLRETLRREAAEALRTVDLIALPTTSATAPLVTDAELASGFIDTAALDAACRFAFFANLTGLPAATAPVGNDPHGLPIGLQFIGDAWDEACVLQTLAHLERVGVAKTGQPASGIDLLV